MAIRTPVGAVEIVSARTEHAKLFQMPNQKRKLIVSRRQQHTREGDIWRDIDTDFERSGNTFHVKNACYRCTIQTDRILYQYESKANGTVRVELTHIGINEVRTLPALFNPIVSGNTITFHNLLPDLDIVFEAKANGLYVYKILHSASAARDFTWLIERSSDSPQVINRATEGHDNHGLQSPLRRAERRRNVCRRIEMRHSVTNEMPRHLDIAESFNECWTGRTFWRNLEGVQQLADDVEYPVFIDQDITEPITVNIDDGYQTFPTIYFYNTNTQAFFGYYGTNTYYDFFRFRDINLARGEDIELAELTVNVNSVYGAGNSHTVYGYDTDSSAVWANPGVLPSNVTRTTATANISLTSTGLQTVDVTTIVREITARSGWTNGNDMSLFFAQAGTTGANNGGYIENYEGAGQEPFLEITLAAPLDRRKTLTHLWRMEESSGDRLDSIGERDLTVQGTDTAAVAAVVDNGLDASAGGTNLNSGTVRALDIDGGDEFTVSGWVNFANAAGSLEVLFDYANALTDALRIRRTVAGFIEVAAVDTNSTTHTVTGTTVTAASTNYFIAVTYKRNDFLRLYLNAVEEGTAAALGNFAWASTDPSPRLNIGSRQASLDRASAVFDEWSTDNRALPLADVLDLYNSGSGVNRALDYIADLHTGLIGHWPFEEASGTRADAVGSYDFSTVVGDQGNAVGMVGNGVRFNTATTRFDNTTTPPINNLDAATISMWFRFDDPPTQREALLRLSSATGAPFLFLMDRRGASSDFLDTRFWNDSATSDQNLSAITIDAEVWYHAVVVYRRNAYQRLYLQGTEDNANEGFTDDVALEDVSAAPLTRLGDDHVPQFQAENAVFDELSMWNRALTTGQVKALNNGGAAVNLIGVGRGLVHLYQLEEDSGTREDAEGALNLVTIVNDTVSAVAGIINDALDATGGAFRASSAGTSVLNGAGDITIHLWVSFSNAAGSVEAVVSCGTHQVFVERVAGGQIRVGVTDQAGTLEAVTGTTVTAASTFYHVALTRERGGFLRLYVDGVEEGSAVAASNLFMEAWATADISVAAQVNDTQPTTAIIDEVAFHDVSLLRAEVDSHYNGGAGVNLGPASFGASPSTTMAAGFMKKV